jgi:DNA-binding transcriptional LysR family regulator
MEMQQVRYFLAVSRTLNFTRAAEECNVTQPALTRAIKQLEDELGGELIRREGRNSHLTDLGNRMQPLLQQCYDSAIAAKQVASKLKKGEVSVLAIGVSWSLDIDLLLAPLNELVKAFPTLQLRLRRGTAADIAGMLKNGEVELAIGGPLEQWDRLDAWPMFTESFGIIVGAAHKLAEHDLPELDIALIKEERLLRFAQSDPSDWDSERLASAGIDCDNIHEVNCSRDLEKLIAGGFGVAILPASTIRSRNIRHIRCAAIGIERTVAIYSVAGRQRSREASALLNLLRAADWEEKLLEDVLHAA